GRQRRRHDGDAKRHPGRVENTLVLKQRAVPLRRPSAPHRDQLRLVEAVDHQEQDRDVEKREPERDRGGVEPAEASHRAASRSFSWLRWNSTIGTTSTSRRTTATADETGQSRLAKNSNQSVLPIISVSEPPSRSGITNSPVAGMNTRKQPASTPGSDSGKVICQKARKGRLPRSAAASSSVWSSRSSAA